MQLDPIVSKAHALLGASPRGASALGIWASKGSPETLEPATAGVESLLWFDDVQVLVAQVEADEG